MASNDPVPDQLNQAIRAAAERAAQEPPAGLPPGWVAQPAKNPGVAAVLSFFICGLGQIYNGQIGKGLLFLVALALSLAAIAVGVGVLTTPLLWLWGIVDAYRTAERINQDTARFAGPGA